MNLNRNDAGGLSAGALTEGGRGGGSLVGDLPGNSIPPQEAVGPEMWERSLLNWLTGPLVWESQLSTVPDWKSLVLHLASKPRG